MSAAVLPFCRCVPAFTEAAYALVAALCAAFHSAFHACLFDSAVAPWCVVRMVPLADFGWRLDDAPLARRLDEPPRGPALGRGAVGGTAAAGAVAADPLPAAACCVRERRNTFAHVPGFPSASHAAYRFWLRAWRSSTASAFGSALRPIG